MSKHSFIDSSLSHQEFCDAILEDYTLIVKSRFISEWCRKEVLQGIASFGISGDGKELPQVVISKYFQKGDFLSGYYRDQTLCFAKKIISEEAYFSQLYADTEAGHDVSSSGRQMNSHFATPFIDKKGSWIDLANHYNVASNMSQTAGQLPRSLGLAYASHIFRKQGKKLNTKNKLSEKGNEVCFCTIGDASTSEGHFLETVYTAATLDIPLAIFIWDDDYGISVPSHNHMPKGDIIEAISGMQRKGEENNALDLYKIKGWDYVSLHEQIAQGIKNVRTQHRTAVFHIEELTQPLGHSTSGSHERYKSKKRLQWESEFDCNKKMREWILSNQIASEEQLKKVEQKQEKSVKQIRENARHKYLSPIKAQQQEAESLLKNMSQINRLSLLHQSVKQIRSNWTKIQPSHRHQILSPLRKLELDCTQFNLSYKPLKTLVSKLKEDNTKRYNTFLYSESKSAAKVKHIKPKYAKQPKYENGFKVINHYFDTLFKRNPFVFAFGEDVGEIGDVNQGFSDLQKKHGKDRIFDTSIRELTIVGQAIGMALRGLRPIAEIQYLDYLLYGLQPLSDDVATLHFRTAGIQSCPLIIRTRGHRFEGIWHSGSPISMMANTLKGVMIGVPRNMTQAAAMYNSLIASNDPGIVVESLNGYRLKEAIPSNLDKIQLPFGLCEVLEKGQDITVVSYGSILRIVGEAAHELKNKYNITCEVIDIQTVLPFDTSNIILKSLKKTNRIIFIDEDVEGGYASSMLHEVIDAREGFYHLDATPRAISAKAHRTSYGRDGEYFGKPSLDDIMEAILKVIRE